ncbi:prepilin peptidase [Desulfosarcina cetonica]|uniref:prepilin peptidase n=1 Tax=Desulfosarcina cetonica TaxID=90730 RepID=UPI000A6F648F|nr:prepilin peptidase [Desulfosarcina cetonica]
MLPSLFIDIVAFIFGACIGSFLNVCIYRIPEGLSIVYPGSRCPRCETIIPFYDNIPIISYLLLAGKCRTCHLPIALRYPFVELLGGLFGLASVHTFGPTVQAGVVFVFIATLIVVTFIDLDHRIIPDRISLPGNSVFFSGGLCPSCHCLASPRHRHCCRRGDSFRRGLDLSSHHRKGGHGRR